MIEGSLQGTTGRSLTLVAQPAAGFGVVGCYEGAALLTASDTLSLVVDRPYGLTAVVRRMAQVELIAAPDSGGQVTVLDGELDRLAGRPITVRASAASGWQFYGWSADGRLLGTSATLVLAHQALDAVFAARLARFPQVEEHPRRAVDALARRERGADEAQELCVLDGPVRLWLPQPLIAAAGRHARTRLITASCLRMCRHLFAYSPRW